MTDNIRRHDNAYRYKTGDGELITTGSGIIFGSLKEGIEQHRSLLREYIHDFAEDGHDGVLVYVPNGVVSELPFELEYGYNGVAYARTLVILEQGSQAKLFIYVNCNGPAVREERDIIISSNANLTFAELIVTEQDVELDTRTNVKMMSGSVLDGVSAELGQGKANIKFNTDLSGQNIECRHSTLFLISGDELTSIDETVNHLIPDCHSDILVKGVASGSAKGNFRGMVYVAQDAQHTQAYQQSRNLLLSNSARIETSPQLEIYADDVKCSHGATVGYVDDDSLYYMRQRGLSEMQARKLQLKGFVDDVLMRCGDEVWLQNATSLAEHKIDLL